MQSLLIEQEWDDGKVVTQLTLEGHSMPCPACGVVVQPDQPHRCETVLMEQLPKKQRRARK